ncbi:MAG: Hsp20/alpha crystallin family protein [Candidatus Bathyarchaeota archaeon]|nr:Hsp20/alpha crystallin family protein [Candidatus Bathyarchaeota archaeon]
MSARWRRSKKHLKWLDLKNFRFSPKDSSGKPPRIETVKAQKKTYPPKYRLPKKFGRDKWRAPKPLIDMFQDNNWVTIVAEVAGFNQETVKVNIKNQKLILSAKATDRKYYKSLNLPKVVIPNVAHKNLKNGVIEIKLKKAQKQQTLKQQEAGLNDAT